MGRSAFIRLAIPQSAVSGIGVTEMFLLTPPALFRPPQKTVGETLHFRLT
jgi:hypothetical protein